MIQIAFEIDELGDILSMTEAVGDLLPFSAPKVDISPAQIQRIHEEITSVNGKDVRFKVTSVRLSQMDNGFIRAEFTYLISDNGSNKEIATCHICGSRGEGVE